ncbi:metallophosphoesterase [Haliangium sp.]|uniref:metallophosphoesterase n=1 Tax=Haliangium sp. TaxID=2663208 RepID=UPI003D116888
MSTYLAAILTGYVAVTLVAFRHSRAHGVISLITLAFPTWVGMSLRPHLGWLGHAIPGFQLITYAYFVTLVVRAGVRSWPLRIAMSLPAHWFVAATFLAFPWAIVAGLSLPPYGAWLPFVLCLGGLVQSLWTREEVVDLRLEPSVDAGPLRRFPEARGAPTDVAGRRPLRLIQISDPHLGPFMSVARLRRICERAVAREPDLILLTGDLITMESQDVALLSEALAPLTAYRGRVFACHGNHDHEARDVVERALAKVGVTLLVDEAVAVATPAGPVQIVGVDFTWRDRRAHLRAVCEAHPRDPDALRLVLLHDPSAFQHLPEGEADLVLSGHTHGGQVGLLSVGLPHTFISVASTIPDHGPWARGRDRLYVHRAQGHYGFPLRLGVPGEQSLMQVWR